METQVDESEEIVFQMEGWPEDYSFGYITNTNQYFVETEGGDWRWLEDDLLAEGPVGLFDGSDKLFSQEDFATLKELVLLVRGDSNGVH